MLAAYPVLDQTNVAIPGADVASACAAFGCMVQIDCARDGASHDSVVPSYRQAKHVDYVVPANALGRPDSGTTGISDWGR